MSQIGTLYDVYKRGILEQKDKPLPQVIMVIMIVTEIYLFVNNSQNQESVSILGQDTF